MDPSLQGKIAVVVGGSRGLGRGAVEALAARGAEVVVIGRDPAALSPLAGEVRGTTAIVGDGTDEALAESVLRERRPDLVVLCAGAAPVLGAIHELSWAEFQTNWHVDAKLTFGWLRQALRLPMKRGSHVIVISSGAAAQGSPVSGGYASAKRAQWFMADYAATEIERAGLGIRIHCVLPALNPSTDLGRAGIAAYARRAGVSDEEFAKRFGPPLTPAIFGAAIADLATSPEKWAQLALRLCGGGLAPLS
jgi:NAD(P)-dependent dehydrogenase (short-subunit alcohol dehydrogenase family)